MANKQSVGANISVDISGLRAGLQAANRAIRESETQFKQAAAGMQDWTQEADGLQARINHLNTSINEHNSVIAKTKAEKDRVIKAMQAEGKSQEEINKAVEKANDILIKEYNALEKNKKELDQTTKKLDDFGKETDDAGKKTDKFTDSTEKTSKGLSALKGAAAIGVAAIAAVGAAAVAGVKSLLDLAESTREYREDLNKLQAGFTTAGFSAEAATKVYKDFYAVLGEEDRSVEAVNHLAKLVNTEQDLEKWTNICTGVWATFGDSLPIEGLTEAANETAKVGDLTGVLADALNWAGVNEDEFQKKLDACANETERTALITETLNGLYSDAAKHYKELNGDIMDANRAQSDLTDAMAELGAAVEPLNTKLTEFKTSILSEFTPAIMQIVDDITAVASGTEGATDKLAASIDALISDILNKFVEFLPQAADFATSLMLAIVETIIEQLPNITQAGVDIFVTLLDSLAEMTPSLIPTITDAVILMAETLINNVDKIVNAGISLIQGLASGLVAAIPDLLAKVPTIIESLFTALMNNLPTLLNAGVNLILELANGLMAALPDLLAKLPTIIAEIVKGLITQGIPALINAGGQLLQGLFEGMLNPAVIWENVKKVGNSILDGIKSFFGIHSPSTVFRDEIGEYLGEGMALGVGDGFSKRIKGVNNAIVRAIDTDGIVDSLGANRGADGRTGGRGGVVINQYNTYSQAHSRYELYRTKQATAAAVRLAVGGGV